jgi:hypothetical protein
MSDYLNNLAAKSLHLTEVIQPRLASLFEPPSVVDGPVFGHSSSNVETAHGEQLSGETLLETPRTNQVPFRNLLESRPSMIGLRQPPDTLQQQPGGVADRSTGQHPGQSAGQQPSPLIVPQSGETRPEQFPTQLVPNPARMILTQTPAPILQPGAVGPSDTKTTQRSHLNTPVLVPLAAGYENDAAPSRNTGEQDSQSALEQNTRQGVDERITLLAAPQSQNVEHPESVSRQARRSFTPAMTVVQPHVTLHREPPASAATGPIATPGPTPTIRITIGRVDVRAIMPVTPAPRPNPTRPGPALSLEDYLKQREQGRR